MRIGCFQFDVRPGKQAENLETVARALRDVDADLVVLPELFTTGYLFRSRAAALELSEPVPDGPTVSALRDLARVGPRWLVGSIVERVGPRLYNTAVVVGRDGLIARHRKRHLPPLEVAVFERGRESSVIDLGGLRIGLMICFEAWFPELCRRLTLEGADVLCHPANFGGTMSLDVARTRAIENGVFAVTANRTGREKVGAMVAEFRGESRIVAPFGPVLFQADGGESLGIVEIDPRQAREKRRDAFGHILREAARCTPPAWERLTRRRQS